MNPKLKSRLLVGLLSIPLLIFFFLVPSPFLYLFVIVLVALCYYEAMNLIHDDFYTLDSILGFFAIVSFITPQVYTMLHLIFNPGLGIVLTLIIMFRDIFKNKGFYKTTQHYFIISYLSLGFYSINNMFYNNRLITVFIFILIWTFDSLQYFVGRKFGKKKIFAVSPNKSLEGLIGGALFTLILYVLWFSLFRLGYHQLSMWTHIHMYKTFFITNNFIVILSFYIRIIPLVIIFGIFGDLLVSQMKRSFEVKDSSNALGEHGGFLDRLDSVISVCIAINVLLFM